MGIGGGPVGWAENPLNKSESYVSPASVCPPLVIYSASLMHRYTGPLKNSSWYITPTSIDNIDHKVRCSSSSGRTLSSNP